VAVTREQKDLRDPLRVGGTDALKGNSFSRSPLKRVEGEKNLGKRKGFHDLNRRKPEKSE